jgi:hypothetical protein
VKYCVNEACPGLSRSEVAVPYADTEDRCSDCGGALRSLPEETGDGPLRPEDELVELVRFETVDDGMLAQGRLQADGIDAVVDDRSFSVLPVLSSARPQVRILVPVRDVERSQRSLSTDHGTELQEIAEASLAPGADDACPSCGGQEFLLRRFLIPRGFWAAGLTVVALVVVVRFLGIGIRGLAGAAATLYAINIFVGPTLECKVCHHRWPRK